MTLSERIEKDLQRLRELTQNQQSEASQVQTSKASVSSDVATRRQFIFGEYFMKFADRYPCFQRLQPQETEAQNCIEFTPVERFLSLLESDSEYMDNLIAKLELDLP
jgi:hypothetical protein